MSEASPPAVETVALIRDLLFSSKVSAAARLSRVRESVRIVRDAAKLQEIDAKRLEAAVAWKTRTGGEVTGFVAHVNGDAIAAARSLGIDRVLTNGGFSANVDTIVRGE